MKKNVVKVICDHANKCPKSDCPHKIPHSPFLDPQNHLCVNKELCHIPKKDTEVKCVKIEEKLGEFIEK